MWRAPTRSAAAAAIYEHAENDRRVRPERYALDLESIVSSAVRVPGDELRFADGWREGLDAYLGSADADGRLNAIGRAMVTSTAIGRLRAGPRLVAHLDAHPSLRDVQVDRPIVIVGGWRTGTTFLFRLLASDRRLRAPLPSELASPVHAAGLRGPDREAFIDAGAAAHERLHLLNPQLRAIHDSGARLAEECVLAMGYDLRNWGFTSTFRLDSYARWLSSEDFAPAYRRHRDVLRILDDGRRWVLKAPAHTAELDSLVAAFPGAVVVHLHRDIVETIASGASLFATFHSTYSDDVDAAQVGAAQADQTELWLRRSAAFRVMPEARLATFVDVEYTDLMEDPLSVLASIYTAAALEAPPDLRTFVDEYHRASPRDRHGRHQYEAADFGLDAHALRERFAGLTGRP